MDYMRKMMRGKFVEMVKATMSGAAKEWLARTFIKSLYIKIL
jgi:hypothetical protein